MAEQFAAAVRRFRLRAGLTQEALAERSGVSVSTIRGIETGKRGNPQLASVRQLAEALGLPQQEQDALRAPRQLPPELPGFVGRAEVLRRLDTVDGTGITVISGTAGVGKTTTALHWAHRVAHRFADGQLYVDLRGFDPSGSVLAPDEALRMFLDALGVPSRSVPDEQEARTALYRTLMAGRSMLLVLDNARDGAQIRPLLPGAPDSLVIVTSRHDLTGLVATTSARSVPLDLLNGEEARALLADRLGEARVAAEPGAVAEIVDRCAGLPLALAVVSARAAHTSFSLTAYAEDLRWSGLDGFDSGDEAADLRAVYACSYRALSPAAARTFRLLGLHPATEIALPAVASLTADPAPRRALQELVRAHMLTERTPGRYAFHDLLRAYAAEQVDPDERQEALHRLVAHYRHNAENARAITKLRPGSPPAPGVVTITHADATAANSWLTTEMPVLLAIARSADGFPDEVLATIRVVANVLDSTGGLAGNADVLARGEALAVRLGDRAGQAAMWKMTARLHMRLGERAEAEALLLKALEADEDDLDARAYTQVGLGMLYGEQGRHREALEHARQAAEGFHAAGNRHAEAESLNGMAWCHATLGEFDEAAGHAQRALAMKTAHRSDVLDTLGYVEHRRGNLDAAVTHYLAGVAEAEEEGDLYSLAEVLAHLGDAHQDPAEARRCWQRAADLYEELHSPLGKAVRKRLNDDQRGGA
ncbi:ATP-binding protein [Lentzea sp. CA-135723]|uniref:ATP-binding protein n=1 Tax=Lentzea sp. CA-135723 TaxID=3239950 RepID=UPI003D9061EE